MKMRALSIRQPFAWAIVHCGKDVENRTWETLFRGPVLIHAGKTWHSFRPSDLEAEMRSGGMNLTVPRELPRGGIIGMAEIVGCVRRSESPWFSGPFGFVLANPRPLPFLPCVGRLGFFCVDVPSDYTARSGDFE